MSFCRLLLWPATEVLVCFNFSSVVFFGLVPCPFIFDVFEFVLAIWSPPFWSTLYQLSPTTFSLFLIRTRRNHTTCYYPLVLRHLAGSGSPELYLKRLVVGFSDLLFVLCSPKLQSLCSCFLSCCRLTYISIFCPVSTIASDNIFHFLRYCELSQPGSFCKLTPSSKCCCFWQSWLQVYLLQWKRRISFHVVLHRWGTALYFSLTIAYPLQYCAR